LPIPSYYNTLSHCRPNTEYLEYSWRGLGCLPVFRL